MTHQGPTDPNPTDPSQTDPVDLTRTLVRCPSVTPEDHGAIALIDDILTTAGFATTRIPRGGVDNLFARWGSGRTLGFNGHTDVVPTGDPEAWRHDPFAATVEDGKIFGRGSVDMKSGVAAWVAAVVATVKEAPPGGALVVTITGDEEGPAKDGTAAILDWMAENGEHMDACIVGEPTCPDTIGDMIKIGRRGSMTAYITATGVQGHSAYPHRARNPLPPLVRLLDRLASRELDPGTDHFEPSTLALTTIDTGNPANNVIPASARATANIRFNDAHSSQSLSQWIREEAAAIEAASGVSFEIDFQVSGESFVTQPGPLSEVVVAAVEAETGRRPEMSTSGGTSDARFIHHHCPVVEFGLVGRGMHQIDEAVAIDDIRTLTQIYRNIIDGFFKS